MTLEATVRMGRRSDASGAAALHASEINEGFLASLGPHFLTRLYRRTVVGPTSFLVVSDTRGGIGGFLAATTDLRALYRAFLIRDGFAAVALGGPQVVRSWRKVVETLRYPAERTEGMKSLPRAELLAVAVRPQLRGRGVGRALVRAATAEFERRGVRAARVVAAADNHRALALYEACGFRRVGRVDVHAGIASVMLSWP